MDLRLVRIAIGLALESAMVYGREHQSLLALYSNPDMGEIRKLHDRLFKSDDHYEREVAIWLELALEDDPIQSNPKRLANEMREMEFVLHTLINRAGKAQREVNYWMDYIANTAQFILGGYWVDAKIFLSKALQNSRTEPIEQLKSDPHLRYEVDMLQKATVSYFEELKRYPLKLKAPKEMLDPVLSVQKIMLELLKIRNTGEGSRKNNIHETIGRLSSAIRHLIEKKVSEAKRSLNTVLVFFEEWQKTKINEVESGKIESYSEKVKNVINSI